MKKVFAIILKNILVRFASPSEWIFFLVLPLLFTFILGSATGAFADSRIRMPVVDLARTPLSAQLIAELENSQAVLAVEGSLSDARADFDSGDISAALIIPEGFAFSADGQGSLSLQLLAQPNDIDALAAQQAIQTAVQRVSSVVQVANQSVAAAERMQPFPSEKARQDYYAEAVELAQSNLAAAPQRLAVTNGSTPGGIDFNPNASASAGQLITWVFIPLIALCGTFAYERRAGTLRRLITTPTDRGIFLGATIAGEVLIALVQMALLVTFGILVMKVNWGNSPAALVIILVASALAAAAFGTMLGTFVKTEGQASGLSVMLGMVMALLGGCWYPLELFPQAVQKVVQVLPTTWAMRGMLDITMRDAGVSAILPEAGVLLAFAAAFFTVGILRFRYE